MSVVTRISDCGDKIGTGSAPQCIRVICRQYEILKSPCLTITHPPFTDVTIFEIHGIEVFIRDESDI
jgi:hypothetical protein